MIRSIKIKELFGDKENCPELIFNKELTIIVGKNGSGKTTMLDILNSIISKRFYSLFKHKFSEIQLISDNGNINVYRKDDEIRVERSDVVRAICEITSIQITESELYEIQEKIKNNALLNADSLDDRIKSALGKLSLRFSIKEAESAEMKNRYSDFPFSVKSLYLPTYRRMEADILETILEPMMLFSRNSRAFLDERLLDTLNNNEGIIIGVTNKDINSIVTKKWNEIVDIEKNRLNSLIESFLYSFLETPSFSTQNNYRPTDNILEKFDINEVYITLKEVFTKTGIIKADDKEKLEGLKQYVESINEAKSILDEDLTVEKQKEPDLNSLMDFFRKRDIATRIAISYEKIDNLMDMYRSEQQNLEEIRKPFNDLRNILRLFIGKEVVIKEGELRFESGLKNSIKFESLSAGEKQLVTLFVYVKLALDKHSVIIIDEPELSLHLSWQRNFIKALTHGNKQLQFIISTHSPFVVSNYFNSVLELGPRGDEDDEFVLES